MCASFVAFIRVTGSLHTRTEGRKIWQSIPSANHSLGLPGNISSSNPVVDDNECVYVLSVKVHRKVTTEDFWFSRLDSC